MEDNDANRGAGDNAGPAMVKCLRIYVKRFFIFIYVCRIVGTLIHYE